MKNWKLIAVCALLFVTIGAVLVAVHYKAKFEDKPMLPDGVKQQIQTEATIIARNVDKNGLQHVTIEAAKNIVPFNQVDKVAISQGIMDTTALALGIQKKQIESLLAVNSTLKAENLRAREILNASGGKAYEYKDKFINLTYTPSLGLDSLDKGKFDFTYNADLTITQYWKRNWFLGAKKSYIDIYSNDSRTTVNGVKQLTVEQKQPAFGLRGQAAVNINPETGSYGLGPAVRIDLGRFSIQGNYTYYPESSRWRPSINANYDLIRF
ncbi:MAG: hypothetical protein EOO42_01180 [Flavobacteriales bacterium]|nr:MAG: hypothetical protein EOO42_01180 [Flavobacteriales bacterium]